MTHARRDGRGGDAERFLKTANRRRFRPVLSALMNLLIAAMLLSACGGAVAGNTPAAATGATGGRKTADASATTGEAGRDADLEAAADASPGAAGAASEDRNAAGDSGKGPAAGTKAGGAAAAGAEGDAASDAASDAGSDDAASRIPGTTPSKESLARAARLVAGMSLEQKAGQMLFPAWRQHADGTPVAKADSDTLAEIARIKPGGIAFFKENLSDIAGTVELVETFKYASAIPAFAGIDEEGGRVARIGGDEALHATRMPKNAEVGATGNPDCAGMAATVIAREIGALGFNLNFAPVADVFSNPKNRVIGDRAYGSDPVLVAQMTAAAVEAYRACCIVAVPKHFPGHGDTVADSHDGEAVTEMDRETLDRVALPPFAAAIGAGAPAVMTAHIGAPNAVGDAVPATLNAKVIGGILRDDLGFSGIVLTDAMEMKGAAAGMTETEACVLAVEAGADMLLMPTDPLAARDALVEAVRSGRLKESTLDGACLRILSVKAEYGILDAASDPEAQAKAAESVLGCEENGRLAEASLKGGEEP